MVEDTSHRDAASMEDLMGKEVDLDMGMDSLKYTIFNMIFNIFAETARNRKILSY